MSRTGVLSSTSWPSSSSPTNFTGQPPPRRKQWNQRRCRPATAQRPAFQAQRSQVQQSIVLVHPFTNLGGSQGLLRGIAINLAERGYAAVTFDCKGASRTSHRLRRDPGCDRRVRVGQSGLESPWDCARGFRSRMTASILFGKSQKLKLFVVGTKDGFTSVKQLQNKLKSAAVRVETHLLGGVGYFQMEGPAYDDQMVDLIATFVQSLQQ